MTEVASCSLFLPWKHYVTLPLFPGAVGCSVTVSRTPLLPVWLYTWWHSSRDSLETEWVAWNGRWFGCLMSLSGISHGNPSRIPPWAGDGSVAPVGRKGGQQQEPQMVSHPSCCWSNIPCPTAQPACAEYAFMYICCLRGLLVGKFLRMSQSLILLFVIEDS